MPLSDRTRRHRLLSDGGRAFGLSELPDDLPLSLKEVCDRVFGGAISVASLKAEHARGNLEISKIGRAYFTTPADLRAMFAKCRVTPQTGGAAPASGRQSEAEQSRDSQATAALASLRLTLEQLKASRKRTK